MSDAKTAGAPGDVRPFQTLALLAAVLLVGANSFVLSPILSDVAAGFGTDPYRVAWSISSFGAATALSALLLAGQIDRRPAGQVLGGAALLLALAQAASGASQGWAWLCLSQALAGVAVGVLLPGTYATAAATAPPGRAAARIGLVLTGWALSLVLAVPAAAFTADHFGWRAVYGLLATLSALVALGLGLAFADSRAGAALRTPPLRALRLPGVGRLLVVMLCFMSAFYGSFAFFGEGLRTAFGLAAQGTGLFVLAYGLGFGLAGLVLGLRAPRIKRGYLMAVMLGIGCCYAGWGMALATPASAFVMALAWGALNQLGLNGLVVSLNARAAEARGAVMGLNSAVTYSAVFFGPMIMGPVYATWGFGAVSGLAAGLVLAGAVVTATGR